MAFMLAISNQGTYSAPRYSSYLQYRNLFSWDKMQRSNSAHLTVETELLVSSPSTVQVYATSGPASRQNVGSLPKNLSMSALDFQLSYELDHNDKKKQSRIRPEHAVHLIPVILFLCGLILWISQTDSSTEFLREVKGMRPTDSHPTVPIVEAEIGLAMAKNNVIRQKPATSFGTSLSVEQKIILDAAKVDTAR